MDFEFEKYHSYNELVAKLHDLEKNSDGAIQLDVIGKSNEQRDIYAAKIGTGKRKVMFITQQHGNEPVGTESALHLLETLSTSYHPIIADILDQITLTIVVRANPDGAERGWRFNYDPEVTPEYGKKGQGYDMNRYHLPSHMPNPVPEARAIRSLYDQFKPELVIDFHQQLTYYDEDGELITGSVFWPNHPNVPQTIVDLSKKVTLALYESLSSHFYGTITQYPGGDYEGIARNAYALSGSGSVLVELWKGDDKESISQLISMDYFAMLDILYAATYDTFEEYCPEDADSIPAWREQKSNQAHVS